MPKFVFLGGIEKILNGQRQKKGGREREREARVYIGALSGG